MVLRAGNLTLEIFSGTRCIQRPSSAFRMIAGLGNPGSPYEFTRHNFGFRVVERMAGDFQVPFNREKHQAVFGLGKVHTLDLLFVKPIGYMNRSGLSIGGLAREFHIKSSEILVVHDDIDLAFGRIKIKEKGGHGGHNGLKSLTDAIGGGFPRIRMGIGRPDEFVSVTDHVLGRFSDAECELVEQLTAIARDAAETILMEGIKAGMNQFNSTRLPISR